ncbi:hypothetical protein J6590_055632 [Homalodisca vitripennis]|nr:hypothetical protein J6590_055632 [Homalodisca vitripennis]
MKGGGSVTMSKRNKTGNSQNPGVAQTGSGNKVITWLTETKEGSFKLSAGEIDIDKSAESGLEEHTHARVVPTHPLDSSSVPAGSRLLSLSQSPLTVSATSLKTGRPTTGRGKSSLQTNLKDQNLLMKIHSRIPTWAKLTISFVEIMCCVIAVTKVVSQPTSLILLVTSSPSLPI